MDKMEAVKLMLDSFNEDNRAMAAAAGMSPETVEDNISKSQDSLTYLLSNAYDKLVQNGVVK